MTKATGVQQVPAPYSRVSFSARHQYPLPHERHTLQDQDRLFTPLWLSLALQVLSDFASERASVVSAATAQVNTAGSEVDALRRLLRLKGRELQQLRHLAQEVLLQRSEVEIFLLSSLDQVRRQGVLGAVCCCLACEKIGSKGHGVPTCCC